jgi:hypothetical protein
LISALLTEYWSEWFQAQLVAFIFVPMADQPWQGIDR